jgi:hypothetical protein
LDPLKLAIIRSFCILFHDTILFCRHGTDHGFRIWAEFRLRNHGLFSISAPTSSGQMTVNSQAYIHLTLHYSEFSEMIMRPVVSQAARETGEDRAISGRWNSRLQRIQITDLDRFVQKDRTGTVMTFPVYFQSCCQLIQIYGSKIEFRFLTELGPDGFLGTASCEVRGDKFTWGLLEKTYNKVWANPVTGITYPGSVWAQ